MYDIFTGTATEESSVNKSSVNNFGFLCLEDNSRYTLSFSVNNYPMNSKFKITIESSSYSPESSFTQIIDVTNKKLCLIWGSWFPLGKQTESKAKDIQVYFNLVAWEIKKYEPKNLFFFSSTSTNHNIAAKMEIYPYEYNLNVGTYALKNPFAVEYLSCDVPKASAGQEPELYDNEFILGNTTYNHKGDGDFQMFIVSESSEQPKIKAAIEDAKKKDLIKKDNSFKWKNFYCSTKGLQFKHGTFQRLILV